MRCIQLFVFRNSKSTTSVRREYQGISLATSPTNHTPPRYYTDYTITARMALYELSHYPLLHLTG